MTLVPSIPLALINKMWPHGNSRVPGTNAGIANNSAWVFGKYGLTTPDVVCIAMGQFSLECDGGAEMVENVAYSPGRAAQVFGRAHPRASFYAGQGPVMFASYVYGGRMGNKPLPSHDGYNFRGRGMAQTTGRDEYRTVGRLVGLDLENNPDMINDPAHALEIAVANFVKCGCLPYAKAGNITMVGQRLNGGQNGAADRRVWTARWRTHANEMVMVDSLLHAPAPPVATPDTHPKPQTQIKAPLPSLNPAPQPSPAVAAESWADWLKRKFF